MERRLISEQVYNNLPEDLKLITELFEGREKDIVLISSLGVLSNCLPNIKGYYDGDDIFANLSFENAAAVAQFAMDSFFFQILSFYISGHIGVRI